LGSLWLAVLAALAIRLVAVSFFYHDTWNPRRDFWPFGWEVGRVARSLAEGHGFASPFGGSTGPSALLTPVYPLLLAGIFKLLGIYSKLSAFAILSLDSLFSALTCIPVFYLARRSFGRTTALWAAWAWALFPYAIYLSATFVWESCLAGLLVATLLLLTLHLKEQPNPRAWPARAAWLGYGLLWGLTALVNAAALALLPFLAGWALYRPSPPKGHPAPSTGNELRSAGGLSRKLPRPAGWLPQAALFSLALVVTLLPWEARNYRTFRQLVPLRDNFWLEVWTGNSGDTLDWRNDAANPAHNKVERAQYDRLGEARYMAAKRREALDFISRHPREFLVTSFRRFVYTWTGYWSFNPIYLAAQPYDPANICFDLPLTLLMLVGLQQAFRRARAVALPYALTLVVYPIVYYVTHPEIQYRHVIDPEVAILAVFGALWLVRVRRGAAPPGPSVSPSAEDTVRAP
jgi:Dolichyl-phosphate-mannose-protein mannosyltransferase